MMFSDEEIKETPENSFMRPGDEIISIREVCLADRFVKKNLRNREPILISSSQDDLDVTRSMFRDIFPDNLEQQARFAWTEEDGNIASLVSDSGFGTENQTNFDKDFDVEIKRDLTQEADTSSVVFESTSRNGVTFCTKSVTESQLVSSTSNGEDRPKGPFKVDKSDPRSRLHFVKYVKRHGRTVKLWECGICSREFQHQYTLVRHLPTHTDERNFHCEVCDKSFRQLSTLSQHRAIHSTDRPYSCEVCCKTFNRVSTLISHRKTHSDQKPYKCTFCPKGFHQKGNLVNHLFTHTNERPYRCSICLKGFNQQSNLVCHKNKAHPEECVTNVAHKRRNILRASRIEIENHSKTCRSSEICEVTSSVDPYLAATDESSISSCSKSWDLNKSYDEENSDWSTDNPLSMMGSGVIVDPIKTYHMGVALATQQTPFALLKPNNSTPVLVKVIDTQLPGRKQMLVPATAEDLKVGGKIVLKNDNTTSGVVVPEAATDLDAAVQIRVPVVAIVVPKIKNGGRLHLSVEEPHQAYHTALSSSGVGEVKVEPCDISEASRILEPASNYDDSGIKNGVKIPPNCTLPPPTPSPPLDLISMDLFEPMECIPIGPQITAVDNIDQPSPSDDSDIFIGKFEESILLSDSD
ncbi:hypothetical protein ACJJTC_010452 [Scirpophaga incertulas]